MRSYKMKIYQDLAGQWRWRLVAPNGKIVADSGDSYFSKSNVERAVKKLIEEFRFISIVIE